MTPTYLLGLDLGTSGVKALLLPESGGDGFSATVDLTLSTPQPGWSEQDPADWWSATVGAIRAVMAKSGVDPGQIAGVATSGQMHGATLLDTSGAVLRPCVLWNDQRSGAECEIITQTVGFETLLRWVGNPALAGFTAPKLLWVRTHEPDVWRRTATVLLPKDYVNFRLSGALSTEVSDASGTLLFDVTNRRWSEPMLEALDLSASLLPPVYASTGVVGHISDEAAIATGLRPGMPVVAGGADNACAAVGMGVVRPGQVLASLGTSGTLVAPSAQPHIDSRGRLHTFCHAVPDTWYLMGVVLSAGGSLRWFRDALADAERARAEAERRDPYDVIMEEAAQIPAGCEGLVFLPYLTGERTPHGDPHARGVFFGLSLRHTRAHMARSVVEGAIYALADSADLMRTLGVDIGGVRATGGGARSAFWRQMLADVLESHVLTAVADTGPAFGAAVIAGVGTDVFPSIPEATDRQVEVRSELAPDEAMATTYRRHHELYDSLYPVLKDRFAALEAL
jgi:xylulokinase